MLMKKLFLVMNPYAGMRKANRYLPDIIALFNRSGYEVNAYMTACQGDAVRAVSKYAPQSDLVVCVGGDGTFNETITGLMRCGADVPIGYIPCGSTNDFAASLHLSTNIMDAARDIAQGTPVPYDIGRFGNRYFSYVASFGAFTKTSYTTPQNIKNALGHTAYILEGIQELSQIRNEHIRVEYDEGVVEGDFLFGAICNSTSIGGILTLDPTQVDMGDGVFELLLVRAPSDAQEIAKFIRALKTQKYNCSMITFISTRHLTIRANPNMPWTLDGEREDGHSLVEVENLHHAIRLMQKGEIHA